MSTDPLEALYLPIVPVNPPPEFAAVLRRRLETELNDTPPGEPMTSHLGELGYFTLDVPDVERAKDFYGSLFGWQLEPTRPGRYHISNTAQQGGLTGGQAPGRTVYFTVEDIQAALAHVRELGGQAGEPETFPYGSRASCADDQGVAFDLWQPSVGPA